MNKIYLHPETKAPISLLELGLHAQSWKLLVNAPEDIRVERAIKRYAPKRDIAPCTTLIK